MSELTVAEFEKKLAIISEVELDAWDLEMISRIEEEADNSTVPLEVVQAKRECSGKISERVPKELHYALLESAKNNGVSLNQYIVYKLAKP